MSLSKMAAAVSVASVALLGFGASAGAQSTFSVSKTTVAPGETVTVTLNTSCLDANGNPDYGNVISAVAATHQSIVTQSTYGKDFIKGDTGVFTFPAPGTYKISRWCVASGEVQRTIINVVAPEPTTTTTTAAPTTTTTTAPAVTTTTARPATTTTAPAVTTTTAAVRVEGVTTTAGSTSQATGATRVQSGVSYTG